MVSKPEKTDKITNSAAVATKIAITAIEVMMLTALVLVFEKK